MHTLLISRGQSDFETGVKMNNTTLQLESPHLNHFISMIFMLKTNSTFWKVSLVAV